MSARVQTLYKLRRCTGHGKTYEFSDGTGRQPLRVWTLSVQASDLFVTHDATK